MKHGNRNKQEKFPDHNRINKCKSNIWHMIWLPETCKKHTQELKHEILIKKKITSTKFQQRFSILTKEKQ